MFLIFLIIHGKFLYINITERDVPGRISPDPIAIIGSMFLDVAFSPVVMGIPGCFADNLTAAFITLAPMASHCLWVVEGEDM